VGRSLTWLWSHLATPSLPLEDPAEVERAVLLHRVLWLSLAGVVGQVAVVALVPTMSGSVAVMAVVGLVLVLLIMLLQRGWLRLVGSLQIYGFGLVISAYLFFGGGLQAGYGILMLLIAVEGALILGHRVGVALTVWGVFACVAVFVVGADDFMLVPGQDLGSVLLSTQLLGVGLVGGLVSWAVFRLHHALRDARTRAVALGAAMDELSEARSASERLVAAMAEPVWVTDAQRVVLAANDAARALISADPVGQPIERWLVLPDLDGRRVRGPGELRASNGPMPVQVSRSSVGQGREERWIFVTTDLSRRVEAEARIRDAASAADDANRAKSHFLANISHELRTPLNAILGYSELLMESADDATRPDLARVHRAGAHLLSLINDLLDMSKIEAGRMEVTVERIAIDALVDEVVSALRPMADAQHNQLTVTFVERPVVWTDRRKVSQVLMNLLSNAVKFTRDGEVTVRVEVVSGELRIAVIDTGRGIDEADMARLFQPFRQLGPDAVIQPGTGLGLVLSQRLAALVHGRIDVVSAREHGSTFTLCVPVETALLEDGPLHRDVALDERVRP
jgi:signal transduction histidine kinase